MNNFQINIGKKVYQNRLYTAFLMGLFAFSATFLSEQFFKAEYQTSFILALATAAIATFTCFFVHILIFNNQHTVFYKYMLLSIFPILYIFLLISIFGTVLSLLNLHIFNVGFTYQIWLQTWAFLGQSYIYLIFSPHLPYYLTCLLFMYLLHLAIQSNNQQ